MLHVQTDAANLGVAMIESLPKLGQKNEWNDVGTRTRNSFY